MLLTILMWIGYAVLGIFVLSAAAFGLVFMISKTIVDIPKHAPDCQCGPCQGERLKAWRAVNDPRPPDPRDVKPGRSGAGNWRTTAQLRVGMYVSGRDNSKTYRVTRLEKSLAGVVVVHLVNISTRKPSSIPVTSDRVDRPMWLVIADEGEWD